MIRNAKELRQRWRTQVCIDKANRSSDVFGQSTSRFAAEPSASIPVLNSSKDHGARTFYALPQKKTLNEFQ